MCVNKLHFCWGVLLSGVAVYVNKLHFCWEVLLSSVVAGCVDSLFSVGI